MIRENDKLIASRYGDPLLNRDDLGLYQKRPERSNWTEFEIRESGDGTRYRVERDVFRWGGNFSYGDWREVEMSK